MINIQKNNAVFVIFLALLAATPPLSTDMYLAAIPQIAESWGVGKELVNLTLVLWFATFSIFVLVSGSLSDKYGRKPILIGGLGLFVVSSFLCGMAQSVYQLIAFRIMQGAAAAAPSAIVMAIIRDKFDGVERQKALGYVMTILIVAPMLAPIMGALLMEYFSWRFIFYAQGSIVLFSFFLTLGFNETVPEKISTALLKLVTRYTIHFKNREFMITCISMGLLVLPFYGFIAFSAVYYISINGLSEKMFSLFFGINALSAMAGSYSSSYIAKFMGNKKALTMYIMICLVAGFCLLLTAHIHYLFFTLFMGCFSYSAGASRPVTGAMILGLVKTDVGSASSFLTFYQFIAGALCMALVSYKWSDPTLVFGLVITCAPAVVLVAWLLIAKRVNPQY